MLSQVIHQQNAVLGAALHGTHVRNDAIQNNIANVDTPGFTARRVEFESALEAAVLNWRTTGQLDLSNARPMVRFQERNHRFRMDASNIDIEREMLALYINSVRADVMVNGIMHNSRMLNTVLQGR